MTPDEPKLIQPISDDQLLAIVHKTLGPNAGINQSRLLLGGQFNTAYYLETQNPDTRLVLRIAPPDDRPLFQYERGMMPAEPWIYERLAAAGVPTARVVALDTSRTVVDRIYIVQEFVDALPLSDASVPEDARRRLMSDAGRYTALIHAVRGEEFGWPVGNGSLRGGPTWKVVFGDLLAETCQQATEWGVIKAAVAAGVLSRFENRASAFDACRDPVLVHNDIWQPNILVSNVDGKWGVRAIIDADRALFADREFEYILWDEDSLRDDFMAGYGTPLDDSVDAGWRRLLYRFYWYLFAAWAYRAQIWKPKSHAATLEIAMSAYSEILSFEPPA